MRDVDRSLEAWEQSLCHEVEVGGLFSRNSTAHKWKAPFRSLSLRESISWRTHDLLRQSVVLYDSSHILGARILLRSAVETLAVLVYLNQMTRRVLDGKLDFHDFSDKTSTLLLGSRDSSTPYTSMNIITILKKCDSRYPGIEKMYGKLSESVHPNYEGIALGYSDVDAENHVVRYRNKWMSMYGDSHIEATRFVIEMFYYEYDEEWKEAFEKLEAWIERHDEELEKTKRA